MVDPLHEVMNNGMSDVALWYILGKGKGKVVPVLN
jgi:hypothetical protein